MNEHLSTPLSTSPDLPSDTTPVAILSQQEAKECHPEEYDAIQEENPLLSVLNIVVDHEMIAPTPLEPKEFHQNDDSCRVPVLRVFGPVLRRDSRFCVEPRQSACLYIHGAFPYLLARPVVAGPDGSLHHASHNLSGHTDWDSVESVERILPDIQATLESTIQSSMNVMNQDDAAAKNTQKVIRRISIVQGRGFYTYCPGPPAPFLRVEYYDPKLRWKVKLMLERGLDVPRSYHPDPLQYQATLTPPTTTTEDVTLEPLVFHCYEAHIPYTMQFFKDYNLAGMSYIHLSGAKFRQSLPKTAPRRLEQDNNDDIPEDALFLDRNTPTKHVWKEEETFLSAQQSTDSRIAFLQQSSAEESTCSEQETTKSAPPHVDRFWTRKETCCDLELDVTVEQILNIKSVMTSLPEDEEERQKIHWRAVPSLREIWRKERQRMQKLLPPKDDFLSHPSESDPPFTLNTKDASTPGARLAAEGMHRLFRPSPGLEEQFQRAMKEILQRHSNSVSQVDNALRDRSGRAPLVASFLTSTNDESPQLTPVSHSPPMDDAVDALGALADQFTENGDNESSSRSDASAFDATAVDALDALSSQFTENYERDGTSNVEDGSQAGPCLLQGFEPQPSQTSSSASQNCLFSQQCIQDPYEFSQRVERGDCTADDPVVHVEELINPNTLTPYSDPEDFDDNGFLEEEEGMTEREFERTLSILATQTFARNKDVHEGSDTQEESSSQQWMGIDSTQPQHENSENSEDELNVRYEGEAQIDENSRAQEAQRSPRDPETQPQLPFLPIADKSHSPSTFHDIHNQLLPLESDALLEYRGRAPARSEVMSKPSGEGAHASGLYPIEVAHGVPKWLRQSTEYGNIRRELVTKGGLVHDWTVPPNCSAEVEPVSKAPSRGNIISWSKKKRRRASEETSRPGKSLKTISGKAKVAQAKSPAWANKELQRDSNSHKLTAVLPSSSKSGENHLSMNATSSSGKAQEIEEVEWESSQMLILSMSPPDPAQPEESGNDGSSVQPLYSKALPTDSLSASERIPAALLSRALRQESGQTNSDSTPHSFSQGTPDALDGIGQQGGRIYVEGGGGLKAKARSPQRVATTTHNQEGTTNLHGSDLPSPLTMMCIEIHVQCRMGRAGVNDSKEIAMRPNPEKDRIFAAVYIFARDPGGGEALEILERGCLFVPNEGERNKENAHIAGSIPRKTMGVSSKLTVQPVRDEKQLLLRLASIVHWKDPDMLLSWDTQGSGLGYIIERGSVISARHWSDRDLPSNSSKTATEIDMARLLGRTPRAKKSDEEPQSPSSGRQTSERDSLSTRNENNGESAKASSVEKKWKGSGLGTEWDDRVGAGAAAASIVSLMEMLTTQ